MRNTFEYFPITHKNVDREMRSRNCVVYLMLFNGIYLKFKAKAKRIKKTRNEADKERVREKN